MAVSIPAYAVGLEPDHAREHRPFGRAFDLLGNVARRNPQQQGARHADHHFRERGRRIQIGARAPQNARCLLAEAGATSHQIAAWTAHHSLSEVEHSTRSMSRKSAVMGT